MLKTGEVDAFFELSDALVQINDQLIIDRTRDIKLSGMFNNQSSVIKAGLASYSASRYEVGRLSANTFSAFLLASNPRTCRWKRSVRLIS